MRAHPLLVFPLATLLGGCAGDDKDSADDSAEVCATGYQVYVAWDLQEECGFECPEGSFEAYTDGDLLVCDDCEVNEDCDPGQVCSSDCGPGCEDDTSGGCCAVNRCE